MREKTFSSRGSAECYNKRYLILLGFLLLAWTTHLLPPAAFSQNENIAIMSPLDIKFDHFSMAEGLSNLNVVKVLRDSKGFLWVATRHGLHRYDGYRFAVYEHDPDAANSLSHNHLTAFYEDRRGTLWVGAWLSGLNRFNRESETFDRFQHDPDDSTTISHNEITCIYEDREGKFWISTRGGGLNLFDRESGRFQHFLHAPNNPQSISSNFVYDICEDRQGVLWIGTNEGLNRFDRKNKTFRHFRHAPQNPHSLSNNIITAISEDRHGTLWVGTMDGLNNFDRENETFRHFKHDSLNQNSLVHNEVSVLMEDHQGILWIGTLNGLSRYDPERKTFWHFRHDAQNLASLGDNNIYDIYEEPPGILWIGCINEGGLNKYDHSNEFFQHHKHNPHDRNSLKESTVWTIHEDRSGIVWIGGKEGVNSFDRATQAFRYHKPDPQNPMNLSFSYTPVETICEDRRGKLWIGMVDGGLNYFDQKTKTFRHYKTDFQTEGSMSHATVMALYNDRAGTIWLGVYGGGLYRFDPDNGNFHQYKHNPRDSTTLSKNDVRCIYEDSQGTLWVGTNGGGLNLFDRHTETFRHYKHDPQKPTSLSNNFVNVIYEDQKGIFWLGTYSGGLNRFDRATETFIRYGKKDGLSDETVTGILEDNLGNLWLGTFGGISKFSPQDLTFKNYEFREGPRIYGFLAGAYCKSQTGEMLFGCENGFFVFHPDSVKDNPYIPPIVITKFKRYNTDDKNGKAIATSDISEKKQIELSYRDNILTFEFAALNFIRPEKNQYAYKLEGFTEHWIHLGNEREVTFTNLDPGEYTLRVKGSNNDGVWNEEGASLKITITPPWWKTKWAYTLYVLCIMGLLYGLRRYELNRLRLKNQLQIKHIEAAKMKELDHLKSRFFANISHEFRTPLTLILGPVEQMRSNQFSGDLHEAYDMMLRNGRRLLRLINQLLDLARLEAGGMLLQARPENLVGFLKGLVFSFASAAERKRIHLAVSATEESLIVYFDRDKLEKIVSNLLSNALKFTPEGGGVTVTVAAAGDNRPRASTATANATANFIEISVADTGPGIPAELCNKIFDRFYQVDASHTREHEGTGIGLALVKELVDLHHGEISVASEVGRGTTFIVRLPLGKAHLRPEELVNTEQLSVTSDQLPVFSDQFSVVSDQTARFEDQASSLQDQAEVERSVRLFGATSDQRKATSNEQQSDAPLILVIEDNRDVRAYIRQYLEPAFKIIEAGDGVDGVAQALETIPDLIICDVMMPKRDGYEVCRILKTDEKTSHVPVIMLTAKADRESKVQGLETGADDYLIKPFDARELLARVHNLIKLRQRLHERFSREITLQPKDIALTSMDEQFLQRAMGIVEEHISDTALGVEFLARQIGMSRVHLNRKLRGLTDQTANEFIRTLRLKRAAQLLQKKSATVLEIAYEVGFSNPSYFAECFREHFGVLPSQFADRNTA